MDKFPTKEICITKVGVLAQWTDSGRRYSQIDGYSQSGAIDWFSYQLANALCANPLNMPCIEVMGGHFSFQISDDCIVSITGAKAEISVNNHSLAVNQILQLKAGDSVNIRQVELGVFNYVGFAAKFKLPLFKDSVCAVKREKKGGSNNDGFGLAAGERFVFENSLKSARTNIPNRLKHGYSDFTFSTFIASIMKQQFSSSKQLPIMFSYQHASFSNIDKRRLIAHTYEISTKFDKMGVRLEGPSIYSQSSVLTSQAMANGAIQIPGDGKPIIMRNDRQTIGGYPVVGVINTLGLAILSQACAHEQVEFTLTNIESSIIFRRFIDLQFNHVLNEARGFIGNK